MRRELRSIGGRGGGVETGLYDQLDVEGKAKKILVWVPGSRIEQQLSQDKRSMSAERLVTRNGSVLQGDFPALAGRAPEIAQKNPKIEEEGGANHFMKLAFLWYQKQTKTFF